MAVYTYRCTRCRNLFTEVQTIQDYVKEEGDKKQCPHCFEVMTPSRVINVPTVIYKGKGFFSTDYKDSHESPN